MTNSETKESAGKNYLVLRRTRLAFVQFLYALFYQKASDIEGRIAPDLHLMTENEAEYQIDTPYFELMKSVYYDKKGQVLSLLKASCVSRDYRRLDILFQSVLHAAGIDFFLNIHDKDLIISEYLVIASSFFPVSDVKFMNAILDEFCKRKDAL